MHCGIKILFICTANCVSGIGQTPGALSRYGTGKDLTSSAGHVASLRYRGRGTVQLTIKPPDSSFLIHLNDHNITVQSGHDWIEFSHPHFAYSRSTHYPQGVSLIHADVPWLRLWLSFSARAPAFIKIGHGDLMERNTLFTFSPNTSIVDPEYTVDPFIQQLVTVRLDEDVEIFDDQPPYVIDDPIILDPSPVLIPPEQRRREHDMSEDGRFFLPVANLPFAARGLFEQVRNFELTEEEIKAIQYSYSTEGCFLNNRTKYKQETSKLPSYLRADLQEPRRTAPGQEMVLEIWLPNGSSPIHNHGDSSAVIRVLHGTIQSEWYNPIMEGMKIEAQRVAGPMNLYAGNYTWMTDSIYQTHKLTNNDPVNVAITIQAYGYEDDARERVDYFYYLDVNCILSNPYSECHEQFFPKSDFQFKDITGIVVEEYRRFLAGNTASRAHLLTSGVTFLMAAVILDIGLCR